MQRAHTIAATALPHKNNIQAKRAPFFLPSRHHLTPQRGTPCCCDTCRCHAAAQGKRGDEDHPSLVHELFKPQLLCFCKRKRYHLRKEGVSRNAAAAASIWLAQRGGDSPAEACAPLAQVQFHHLPAHAGAPPGAQRQRVGSAAQRCKAPQSADRWSAP